MTRVAAARGALACTRHGAAESCDAVLLLLGAFVSMQVNGQRRPELPGFVCGPPRVHLDVVVANKLQSGIFNLPALNGFCAHEDVKAANNFLLRRLSNV